MKTAMITVLAAFVLALPTTAQKTIENASEVVAPPAGTLAVEPSRAEAAQQPATLASAAADEGAPGFAFEVPTKPQANFVVEPTRWTDLGVLDDPSDDVTFNYDGSKYPIAEALMRATPGTVVELIGQHPKVWIGGNKDASKRQTVPQLADNVTLQGVDEFASVDHVHFLGRWWGRVAIRDLRFESTAQSCLGTYVDTYNPNGKLHVYRCVFEKTPTVKWSMRIHGVIYELVVVESQGHGGGPSVEHFAYWDNVTRVIMHRIFAEAYRHTVCQGTVRFDSGPEPEHGGDWTLSRIIGARIGPNGYVISIAGAPKGGTVDVIDCRTVDCSAGGLLAFTDRKMKHLSGGPYDSNRQVLGPGYTWTGENGKPGYGIYRLRVANFQHIGDRTGSKESMQLSGVEHVELWSLPRRRIPSGFMLDGDGGRGVTLNYYGPGIGTMEIQSREAPSTWYVRGGWRDGKLNSAPVVNPDDLWVAGSPMPGAVK